MNQFKNQTKFDINDIIKILPHRYPFILIDKIEITNPGKQLVALKNLTINEPFFNATLVNPPGVTKHSFLDSNANGLKSTCLGSNPVFENIGHDDNESVG